MRWARSRRQHRLAKSKSTLKFHKKICYTFDGLKKILKLKEAPKKFHYKYAERRQQIGWMVSSLEQVTLKSSKLSIWDSRGIISQLTQVVVSILFEHCTLCEQISHGHGKIQKFKGKTAY